MRLLACHCSSSTCACPALKEKQGKAAQVDVVAGLVTYAEQGTWQCIRKSSLSLAVCLSGTAAVPLPQKQSTHQQLCKTRFDRPAAPNEGQVVPAGLS